MTSFRSIGQNYLDSFPAQARPNCEACPLNPANVPSYANLPVDVRPTVADQVVPGEGPDTCPMVAIGIAPAALETVEKRPMVGTSGVIFRRVAEAFKLWPVYLDNLMLCH